jgi:hypothetical protein
MSFISLSGREMLYNISMLGHNSEKLWGRFRSQALWNFLDQ